MKNAAEGGSAGRSSDFLQSLTLPARLGCERMMRIWYSNSLELLARRLVENERAGSDGYLERVFTAPRIVVPNRNIESYLKFEISRTTGIAANFRFCFLDEFLAETLQAFDPACRLLHRQ